MSSDDFLYEDDYGNTLTPWGAFTPDTFRWTDPYLPPDVSLPPSCLSVALLHTPGGGCERTVMHVYIDRKTWGTLVLYHHEVGKRRNWVVGRGQACVCVRMVDKEGRVRRGVVVMEECRRGEVKQAVVSQTPCIHVEIISREEYDQLDY